MNRRQMIAEAAAKAPTKKDQGKRQPPAAAKNAYAIEERLKAEKEREAAAKKLEAIQKMKAQEKLEKQQQALKV